MSIPLYAVMGNPIAHSLSPVIHQQFAEQTSISLRYSKIEVPVALFEQYVIDFFNQPEGKGLNITLPFKERAFAMAQVKSPRCLQAGAANTLWMADGQLHADNTDGVGLIRDLSRYIDLTGKTIVLLGSGGAARGVIGALLNAHPARLIISNRTLDKAHALKTCFPAIHTCGFEALTEHYDVIINATSASLADDMPRLPAQCIAPGALAYEMMYGKITTPFMTFAVSAGARVEDGLGMLVEQAAESFFLWRGVRPETGGIIAGFRRKLQN